MSPEARFPWSPEPNPRSKNKEERDEFWDEFWVRNLRENAEKKKSGQDVVGVIYSQSDFDRLVKKYPEFADKDKYSIYVKSDADAEEENRRLCSPDPETNCIGSRNRNLPKAHHETIAFLVEKDPILAKDIFFKVESYNRFIKAFPHLVKLQFAIIGDDEDMPDEGSDNVVLDMTLRQPFFLDFMRRNVSNMD